jgi:hypothetical protein
MRNPILAIAIAFLLAAPCTALAGGKKKGPTEGLEITSTNIRVTPPRDISRVGPAKTTAGTPRSDGGGATVGRSK